MDSFRIIPSVSDLFKLLRGWGLLWIHCLLDLRHPIFCLLGWTLHLLLFNFFLSRIFRILQFWDKCILGFDFDIDHRVAELHTLRLLDWVGSLCCGYIWVSLCIHRAPGFYDELLFLIVRFGGRGQIHWSLNTLILPFDNHRIGQLGRVLLLFENLF